jgi:hypothetical protein
MKNLLVVAIAVAILAAAGHALGQGQYANSDTIAATAFNSVGEGIQDDAGNPLADHSAVAIGVLNAGATESSIQSLFAAGNVQGILNDFDVLCTSAIGVGGSIEPGTTAPPGTGITDYSVPGYFYGSTVGYYCSIPAATVEPPVGQSLIGEQVYMLAVNATLSATNNLTTANGISQMGMWTIKGSGNAAAQWIMPAPNPITPSTISPDPGAASPAIGDPADTLDAVIGPGEQPCGAGWLSVFDTVWPGTATVAGSYGVQLAPVPPLPGDANGDGKVDINDLTIVLAHYGRSGMIWSQGEFTGDGTVDINDLTIVLAHYGQSQGASAAGTAAVPEPSCLVLLGIGGAGLLASLWRKRR